MNLPGIHVSEFQADALDDNLATAQTIQIMCAHIRAAVQDPVVQATALSIPLPLNPTRQQIAERVWQWCKQNIRFVLDEVQLAAIGKPDERELLISPSVMVRTPDKKGDCDCFVMSACALLACLGVPPLVATFKCDRGDLKRWSHICAAGVMEDGSIFPVDASHGKYPGWSVLNDAPWVSQLWGMNGKPTERTLSMKAARGLSGYESEPGWTGTAMTDWGPVAGPYADRMFQRAYYPYNARQRGLAGIALGRFGLGADNIVEGDYSTYGTGTTPDVPSGGDSGGGIDWGNILGSLIKGGTQIGTAALASSYKPGMPVPAGYAVSSTGQLVKVGSSTAGISTNTLLIGGLVLGGIVLVLAMKK